MNIILSAGKTFGVNSRFFFHSLVIDFQQNSSIMADIKQWFMSIPVITRYWFGLSFVIPVLGRIGLFNPYHMFMTKDAIWKLEVFRFFFVEMALIF